ncbi:LuxR C-terminal-related transcriptional regulator [Variovorax sp. dw_954]|uniref:LuxR C-terminal-related transcriptional regulator n=1 Tax=Variovorax sp. dw_954 TaxID=2720078 RepID=UPI001BD33E0D
MRTRAYAELLTQARRPKVINVVAPIGYGKTVLMAQLYSHLAESGHDAHWIGLDERDASADRVLAALLDQLATRRSVVDPTQALMRGDEPLERRIDALVTVLSDLPGEATVFIDNLNSCTDEALGPMLNALVFRTPATVTFIWSSTNEIPFDAARAKLEERLRQIGYGDLSLDARETGDLLGVDLGRDLGSAGVSAVQARTEGWPAAVRMAQIVLSASERPLAALDAFSGSDEDISALLHRQVLVRISPELRDFLMCLSLLRTFGIAMCRYVMGTDDARDRLDFLLKRNVFIVPLDRNRKRYRLHSLFREYLGGEAALQLNAGRRKQVLVRASEWCEQAAEWHDAISYALAADELATAARLMERSAHVFVRENGDIQQFIAWVDRLRGTRTPIGWESRYWYVWALVFQRRFESSLQHHRLLVEQFVRRGPEVVVPADLGQRIQHLRICIDYFADRLDDAQRGVDAWLVEHVSSSAYGVGSIGCILSLCQAFYFRFEQAWKTMRAAQPVLLGIDGADMVGWISLIHAAIMTYEGDYQHALDELGSGLAEARKRLGDDAVLCGTMALVASHCATEMGEIAQARELLVFGMRTARNTATLDLLACGFDAALQLWTGRDDELVSVARLRELAAAYPPRLALMLSCQLIQRLGRTGDALAEAERIGLLADCDDAAEVHRDELVVPRARDLWWATAIDLLIAVRRMVRADVLITREYRIAKEEGRASRLVELGLARARIALHAGDETGASRALAGSLRRAARRRIVRPFKDHSELVAALTHAGKISTWTFALAEERAFFEEIARGPAPGSPDSGNPSKEPDAFVAVSAPTAREAELLVLLDLGLSNQEIADRTQVSITTIKWHLKNLYRKLGVSTRTAALARARSLTPALEASPPGPGISR